MEGDEGQKEEHAGSSEVGRRMAPSWEGRGARSTGLEPPQAGVREEELEKWPVSRSCRTLWAG